MPEPTAAFATLVAGGPELPDPAAPRIERLQVAAYTVPTDYPESDGTLEWTSTTLVLVHAHADGKSGLGYTYAHEAAGELIERTLASVVTGRDATSPVASWNAMRAAVRNLGWPGLVSCAVSAVDSALWDLKARLLNVPLVRLLGSVRDRLTSYASGGFTSYPLERLEEQLEGWAAGGFGCVKMKVGRQPQNDLHRVHTARDAIGDAVQLFVDANGAYSRKEALAFAQQFADHGVTWFEEPVSSDDLDGLRLLRDRAPAGMDIAAGEYGYDAFYFRRMLDAGAVDVVQADATRCGGLTGLFLASALCEAAGLPLSAHTAPALHLHPCCALTPMRHLEYFHDHARIEQMLFDNVQPPVDGTLAPDLSSPGNGLVLRRADARRFAV